mmetsp:Transcript_34257/g.101851  ORF Transcript_34257/g.101851 Transcript_34257/m.101851 type:complete len:224 (+) Transcript_34257:647-1318(+)
MLQHRLGEDDLAACVVPLANNVAQPLQLHARHVARGRAGRRQPRPHRPLHDVCSADDRLVAPLVLRAESCQSTGTTKRVRRWSGAEKGTGRAKSSARACFLRHTAADAAFACAAAIAASSSSFSAADCSCSCSGKPATASALRRATSALAAASRASFLRSPSALNAASFRAWIAPRVRFLPSSIPSTTALAAATAAAASGAVLAAAIAGGNQQHLAGGGDLYR